MNTKNLKSGEVIFRQGQFSATMFDILSGKVGVFADYGTEKEQQVATLGAGETVGEMGLIECYPRTATVVALEDGTEVSEVSAEEFSEYFKDKPEKVLGLMKQLSHRLRETTANYAEVCGVLSENDEAGKAGKEKTGWLQSRLKFFSDVYRSLIGAN